MKGKMFLGNGYNYSSKVSEGDLVFNIARGDIKGEARLFDLAPSKELFDWYRANMNTPNWFDSYEKVYMNQLKSNQKALKQLSYIKELLDSGVNVHLLCFCRDYNLCHRSLIGRLFENKGYQVVRG